MDREKENQKLSWVVGLSMILLALIFDVFSIIPIVGGLLAVFAYLIIGAWLWFVGKNPISPKKAAAPVISVVIEFIPAISIIPSIALATAITILIIKTEEVTGINVSKLAQGKMGGSAKEDVEEGVIRKSRARLKREASSEQSENIITPKRSLQEVRENNTIRKAA